MLEILLLSSRHFYYYDYYFWSLFYLRIYINTSSGKSSLSSCVLQAEIGLCVLKDRFFFTPVFLCTAHKTSCEMQRHVLLTRSCRYALPVICRSSSSSCWTETATKDRFIEEEKAWDAKVQWDSLSPEEAEIVRAHKRAILNELTTYDDDKGRKVKTRLDHFLRGSCCGNGCRHV